MADRLVALVCVDQALRTLAAVTCSGAGGGRLAGVLSVPEGASAGDRRDRRGRDQSRKLSNCSGIPKSSALQAAITAWRSSRFFPVTRSWSPWVCELTPLRPRSLMNLLIFLAWSDEIPAWMVELLAGGPLAASSIFPVRRTP